jgi:hypothetical protein
LRFAFGATPFDADSATLFVIGDDLDFVSRDDFRMEDFGDDWSDDFADDGNFFGNELGRLADKHDDDDNDDDDDFDNDVETSVQSGTLNIWRVLRSGRRRRRKKNAKTQKVSTMMLRSLARVSSQSTRRITTTTNRKTNLIATSVCGLIGFCCVVRRHQALAAPTATFRNCFATKTKDTVDTTIPNIEATPTQGIDDSVSLLVGFSSGADIFFFFLASSRQWRNTRQTLPCCNTHHPTLNLCQHRPLVAIFNSKL